MSHLCQINKWIWRRGLGAAGLAVVAILGNLPSYAGEADSAARAAVSTADRVRAAAQSVDRAWEVYHRAALGGTVSSPDQQLIIEQHLHEARGLLAEARAMVDQADGVASSDSPSVDAVLQQIRHHVDSSLAGSRETKK